MTTTDMPQPDYGRPNYETYQQTQRLQLTPEEVIAWQACMKRSSVIAPTFVSAAISYGIFRITPFRAQAKYAAVIGGLIGLITGKLTISEMCLARVASMPNSNLRDRLMEARYQDNQARSTGQYQFQSSDTASRVQESGELSTGIVFDDYPPMTSFDTYSSLNDNSDISLSDDTDLTEPINIQKKGVSYNELRHKNREEFYKKSQQWYTPNQPEKTTVTSESTRKVPTTSVPLSQEKNKYGDVWG